MTPTRLFRGRERAGIYGMRLQLMRHPLGGPWDHSARGAAWPAAWRPAGSTGVLPPEFRNR
jgi:hypothetical protein